MLLPLDSPHWNDLTACYSAPRAIELLRQIVSAGRLGEAWEELRDEITHQGSVYGVTWAALPPDPAGAVADPGWAARPSSLGELWRRGTAGRGHDLRRLRRGPGRDVRQPRRRCVEPESGQRRTLEHGAQAGILARQQPRHIVAVCSAPGLSYRKPILLADRNGTISMWETFGVRLRCHPTRGTAWCMPEQTGLSRKVAGMPQSHTS
jgi:hypothetical protein